MLHFFNLVAGIVMWCCFSAGYLYNWYIMNLKLCIIIHHAMQPISAIYIQHKTINKASRSACSKKTN